MLTINPTPKGFTSTANRDIYSENSSTTVTTKQIIDSAKDVHHIFQENGYYQAIMESDMYIKRQNDDAKY
jgi:hypothetical protein